MAVLEMPDLKRATVYLDEKTTVKCTRQRKYDKRERADTVILTIGKPNCKERTFIKNCKIMGELFPVKKIQLLWRKKS
jgi:hypothetical protein